MLPLISVSVPWIGSHPGSTSERNHNGEGSNEKELFLYMRCNLPRLVPRTNNEITEFPLSYRCCSDSNNNSVPMSVILGGTWETVSPVREMLPR